MRNRVPNPDGAQTHPKGTSRSPGCRSALAAGAGRSCLGWGEVVAAGGAPERQTPEGGRHVCAVLVQSGPTKPLRGLLGGSHSIRRRHLGMPGANL